MKWLLSSIEGFFKGRGATHGTGASLSFARRFGIHFSDPSLLETALTHRSYLGENPERQSNERLEFLGDAVLDLVASDHLFRVMENADEGGLTRSRSRIVNKNVLGKIGMELGVLDLLLYAREEIHKDERALTALSADAIEAIIGAIYLDRGFSSAYKFVENSVFPCLSELAPEDRQVDYKSRLQEISQARYKILPEYKTLRKVGPEHRKVFHVSVLLKKRPFGEGFGRSKKEAEQAAARQAIEQIEEHTEDSPDPGGSKLT
ncbi:MAG: ribonuclease III [bacterium]|jgi:ribonuclease-3